MHERLVCLGEPVQHLIGRPQLLAPTTSLPPPTPSIVDDHAQRLGYCKGQNPRLLHRSKTVLKEGEAAYDRYSRL